MAVGEQVAEGGPDELLSFEPLEDGHGLEIVDHIERRHFSIRTIPGVSPKVTTTEPFEFPVDRGATIDASRLQVPGPMCVYVRNSMGIMIAEMASGDDRTFPTDRYHLELPAPIKIYLVFEGPCRIVVSDINTVIDFEGRINVHIGARSHHKQPAATITTTEKPEDLMVTVSHFGSALKTISCERSYPTLRGHPPAVELGSKLEIPSILDWEGSGITIEVPPNCRSIYTTASLAYYLGAEVVPGDSPRLITEEGFVHPFTQDFESEVERVLKQVFFMDCLTRTEGFYQVNLHERNEFDGILDVDYTELYHESLSGQIERYLEVPYNSIKPLLPKWNLTAHVQPVTENVEMLPFVVNELAVIRTAEFDSRGPTDAKLENINDFLRDTTGPVGQPAPSPPLVRIEETDSLQQAWIGDGAPRGSSKAIAQAYRNHIHRAPTDGDIDITLVCNAPEMGNEGDVVNEVYGSREELPFRISAHRDLTYDELRALLQEDTDFFHYIGHIDAGGFECADGRLDSSSLERTGVDVFFLNSCTSYEQGVHLIEAGSIAGVVTLRDVINSGAERIGKTLARLLNRGFPLQSALNLAKSQSIMGGHYLVIGDGSIDVAQSEGYVPALYELEKLNNEWRLTFNSFLSEGRGMGSLIIPFVGDNDEYFLGPGKADDFHLSREELKEYLLMDDMPMMFEDELYWSGDFSIP